LQGDGSKVVSGKEGFAALLVFGDVPDETLAKQLLASVSPVYLLDFDDDVPVILKLDRQKTRATETRVDEHPADFLSEHGIVAPGYAFTPSPVRSVTLVEGVSIAQAKGAIPTEFEVVLREHPQGALVIGAPVGGILAKKLQQRVYYMCHNPEDGWFCCVVYERDQGRASYSPVTPDVNALPLDNILGETTLEGILRVLAIPGELLGFPAGAREPL
jgi:hypothetical protein